MNGKGVRHTSSVAPRIFYFVGLCRIVFLIVIVQVESTRSYFYLIHLEVP